MKYTPLPTPVINCIDELRSDFHNAMLTCIMKICKLTELSQYVYNNEVTHGIRLTNEQVLTAYWQAAEQACDSWIQNEYETERTEAERDDNIAMWESRKPSTSRHREILELAKLLERM